MRYKKKNLPQANDSVGGYLVGEENGQQVVHEDGNKGGIFVGRSHEEKGGIMAKNVDTGESLLVEGREAQIIPAAVKSNDTHKFQGKTMTNKQILSEINQSGGGVPIARKGAILDERNNEPIQLRGQSVIITKGAVEDNTLRSFDGQMMTNRQILSKINSDAGGVAFADGGEVPEYIQTSGRHYEVGGYLTHDYEIVNSCGCKHKMSNGGNIPMQDGKLLKSYSVCFHDGSRRIYVGVKATSEAQAKVVANANRDRWNLSPQAKITSVDEDNSLIMKKGGISSKVGKLSKGLTVEDIALMHNVPVDELKSELRKGVEHEYTEHTDDKKIALRIALDHLVENPHYYTDLDKFEKQNEVDYDTHYDEIVKKMAGGGTVDPVFNFTTPTGKPSRLTYVQQVLVRTSAFKNFFGDWERAAKRYMNAQNKDFFKQFENVSKVVSHDTLEPRVVYHGTRTDAEFFEFDATREIGVGRPYVYFAGNKEYAEEFTKSSQRATGAIPVLYECFLNIRNPFRAVGHSFDRKDRNADSWLFEIQGVISYDKYGDYNVRQSLVDTVNSQIKKYVDSIYVADKPFWYLMAGDRNKEFKIFLMSHGYDGILCSEGIGRPYDVDNPAQWTYTFISFDSREIKLADGRNWDFDPTKSDIRYEHGGKVQNTENMESKAETTEERLARLRATCLGEDYEQKKAEKRNMYKFGGEISEYKEKNTNFDTVSRRQADVDYVNALIASKNR